ncbi:MAG: DUF1579 family protein, partial [Planctomycetes bacterium]|nr:DUF1579 family protein [Planctomycetota bacterium]
AVVVDNKTVVHSTFNDIWVKVDGKWLINTANETISPSDAKNPNLRELDWAVGSWIEKGEGVEVKTTCRWTLDGAFLIRNFNAVMNGQNVFRGNQIIGWDPAKKCLRSWTFDSDGGFSEGTWTRDNATRWSIASAGVMADGRRVTSKQILEHPDNDTVLFRQVSREAEGQLLPSIPAVKAERQQAE